MREILFKAKRIDNGEWVEGHLFCRKYFGRDEIFESHIIQDAYEQFGIQNFGMQPVLISPVTVDETDGCYRVDTSTICQYTGLTDKNGKKVFIGDIVKCSRGCPHEVIWLEEYGGTYVGGMPAIYLSGLLNGYAWTGSEEVIGTIFDNPELISEV